jgi:Kef-type K+ transport system membrane component KefB
VKLETFFAWPVLTLAGGLLIAAIIGKLASGLGAFHSPSRWVIAIGMVPRGEVGLVFAAIGRTLGVIDDSIFTLGVIDDSIFSAIALMVIVTTVIAPPWLKFAMSRQDAD